MSPPSSRPLRLWPGVAAVMVQWLLWYLAPVVWPGLLGGLIGSLGALAGGLLVFAWWVFFSRASRMERWGGLAVVILALLIIPLLLHRSMATGAMGLLFPLFAVPSVSLALVVFALSRRSIPPGRRLAGLAAMVLLAGGVWLLFRLDGVTSAGAQFAWRWSATAEEQLLARITNEALAPPPEDLDTTSAAAWPGFRGPARDGAVPGVRINTDWSAMPPRELWRRPVGPAWSSFAVHGTLIYTQEQRGQEEIVTCHDTGTGELVWRHTDPVRFWESNAGAGPRATPALHRGHLYALGATGILNALDAGDGHLIWSRDVAAETGVKIPYWGFSGSPLVVEDMVIVAAAGDLAAFDRRSGEPAWTGPGGGGGYSSPHLVTLAGIRQVMLMGGTGATSVAPSDGSLLWSYSWPGGSIVQPALAGESDLLISTNELAGLRRVSITLDDRQWNVRERWTSRGLKPDFNDFVIHENHAYGFDGNRLACIDLADGNRLWKGGRYGKGQLLLLPDQDLLLVISEQGELALVAAEPGRFTELARFPALTGKTWNHPVLVGDLLLVRNDREMAAFRLAMAGD